MKCNDQNNMYSEVFAISSLTTGVLWLREAPLLIHTLIT